MLSPVRPVQSGLSLSPQPQPGLGWGARGAPASVSGRTPREKAAASYARKLPTPASGASSETAATDPPLAPKGTCLNSVTSGHAHMPPCYTGLHFPEFSGLVTGQSLFFSRCQVVTRTPSWTVFPSEASACSCSQNLFPITLCCTCLSGAPNPMTGASWTGSDLAAKAHGSDALSAGAD